MESKRINGRVPVLVAVLILVLGGLGLVRRCGHTDSALAREYVRPGGDTLAVAIEMSPLTYTLHNDTAEGFDYQILRDIAAEHGLTVEFFPIAQLDKAFLGLYNHEYNLLVASMPSTSALKKFFPLTDAVYYDRQVLVQRRTGAEGRGPVTSQEQLLRDTVWVTEGSPFKTRLRNMSAELGETIYVKTDPEYSSEHLAILTALGEVKQAVVSESVAKHIAGKYDNIDIETPISLNQFQCWAVAPGDSVLLDSLNSWLGSFRQTERYRQLVDRYL